MAALPIVGATGALVSILIIDGIHFFNFTTPKFNHDVIQLPFWALAGLSFLRALQTGRLLWWVLLGVALGGALWSKYFVAILVVPLALYLLFDAQSAPQLADARSVCRGHCRARDRGAASRLAGAERFSSLRLCRSARAAVRADFSITSGIRCCFCVSQLGAMAAGLLHRLAAVSCRCRQALDEENQFRFRRRDLPHRHAAGLGTDGVAGRCSPR